MLKKKPLENEILERISSIDKRYLEGIDIDSAPVDPDEFLTWWWNTYAKGCELCPLADERNKVVKPDGKASARIMVVGEGPGFLEDLAGVPMVGPLDLRSSHCNLCSKITKCYDSRLLRTPSAMGGPRKVVKCEPTYVAKHQLLSKAYIRSAGAILDGILIKKWKFNYPRNNWVEYYNKLHPTEPWTHESPWFFTNAVLCRSTDASGLNDAAPASVPRQKCKKWLTFQWAAVNPELIICFGRVALSVLMGNEKSAATVEPNSIVETKFGPVLFQNHPAWFMRERSKTVKSYGYAKIASTLQKALEYVKLPI